MFEETKTVGGSLVRIYQRRVGPDQNIHGAYFDGQSNWYQMTWGSDGRFNPEQPVAVDLIESLPAQTNGPEVA